MPETRKKSTKELARDLGFLRKRASSSGSQCLKRIKKNKQDFAYLVVIDFESTCWENCKYKTQEIIEFPAVLLNTATGEIDSEFHHYVQPQENPYLSDFCKQLTGITQDQVDQGIPLSFTLKRFSSWLQRNTQERNISYDAFSSHDTKCAFVTWSDWDLGVCLQYEARRKQLRKPAELNTWIDLRATYRNFYQRRPQGLNGALQDLGISFEGREHSGLCDARNTAHLAWRMMTDGCVLRITKTLTPPVTGRPCQIGPQKAAMSIVTMPGAPHGTTATSTSPDKIPVTTARPQLPTMPRTGTVHQNQIQASRYPQQTQHRGSATVLKTTSEEMAVGSVQESTQRTNVPQNQPSSDEKEDSTADQQMPSMENLCTNSMSVAWQRVTSCGQMKNSSTNGGLSSDISSSQHLAGHPRTSIQEVPCTSPQTNSSCSNITSTVPKKTSSSPIVISSGPRGTSSHQHNESRPLEAPSNVRVPPPSFGTTSVSKANPSKHERPSDLKVTSGVPLMTSVSPQLTSGGPLRTSVSPQATSGGPLRTSASPRVTSGGPLRTSASPQVTSGGPLRTSVSPQVTSGGPLRNSASPQVTSGGPLRTSASQQVTSGGPLRTSISPQVTSGGPLRNSAGPQVTSGSPLSTSVIAHMTSDDTVKPNSTISAQPTKISTSPRRPGPLCSTTEVTRNFTNITAEKKMQVIGPGTSFRIYQDQNTNKRSSIGNSIVSPHTAVGQNSGKFKTPSPVGVGTKVSGLFKTPSPPCNLSTSILVPSSYPDRVPLLDTSNFMTPDTSQISKPASSNMKRTPPMCGCGRRSHRKLVQTPGPNQGRAFYSCPRGRSKPTSGRTIGGAKQKGCGFFKWEGTKDPNSSVSSNLGSFLNSMSSNSSGHSVKRTQSFVVPPLPQPDFNTPQLAQRLTKETKNTGKTLSAGQSITVGQLRY